MDSYWIRPEDIAPADQERALRLDHSKLEVTSIRQISHPDFEVAYHLLWNEFGSQNEMESRDVIEQRLSWYPAKQHGTHWLRYEVLLVRAGSEVVGVRDHTAVIDQSDTQQGYAMVHLSHVWVGPHWRRSGLSAWLRSWPILCARECLQAAGMSTSTPLTLAAEMEHPDAKSEATLIRLGAYERSGFRKLDPAAVPYSQPDFRDPSVIDQDGGPRPLPFGLVVRRVGREGEVVISGAEVRRLVGAIYSMYGMSFRTRDMDAVWQKLRNYPPGSASINLVAPSVPAPD